MNACILVVDDDPEIVGAIAITLEREGYRVLRAYDGMEALDLALDPAVRLILIDVMMPKLDGLSALLRIREKRNLPVIVLSAKSEDTDKILGLSMGADDYVTKPSTPRSWRPESGASCGGTPCWGTSTRRSGRASSSTGASPTTRTAGNCGRMGKR